MNVKEKKIKPLSDHHGMEGKTFKRQLKPPLKTYLRTFIGIEI